MREFGQTPPSMSTDPMPGHLLTHVCIATLRAGTQDLGLIDNAALAIEDGRIAWIGSAREIPTSMGAFERLDMEGRLVTAGLIDCHTHLVFGGHRAREFEMRLEGATYEELARAGGGILSTVQATRATHESDLLASALTRVDALIAEGVTTLEIKSGYGLDIATELKMLQVARRISETRPIRVRTSFLGAHAIPDEYRGRADTYIDQVCIPALREAHKAGLADAVDGFCEGIAFSPKQIDRVFKMASDLGLPVKLHAEQLSDLGGASLAAKHGALSADHLEYLSEDGVRAIAEAGCVAVLLPGAFYTLGQTQLPPINLLRQHAVPMAIATDCNPGSSPLTSILLAMNLAATLFRLTPREALIGVTRHAARALGLNDCGEIAPGMRADLAIWDVEQPAELTYRIGFNPLFQRWFGGSPC